jgi:hypothetical protein
VVINECGWLWYLLGGGKFQGTSVTLIGLPTSNGRRLLVALVGVLA